MARCIDDPDDERHPAADAARRKERNAGAIGTRARGGESVDAWNGAPADTGSLAGAELEPSVAGHGEQTADEGAELWNSACGRIDRRGRSVGPDEAERR